MGKLEKDKLDFISNKINLLSYEYNKNELDKVESALSLNENNFHPEDTKDNVGLAKLISNSLSFYVKGIFPYRMEMGGGVKLNPDLSIINPYKKSSDDFGMLDENTNNYLKYIRTIYPESISRIAWGESNENGKYLKDLFPEIIQNFNFFDNKKTSLLDMISDNYYLAPVNIRMLKSIMSYISDPKFKSVKKGENKDFYLFSLFLKSIFDKKEHEINNKEYERFLTNEIYETVNTTSSEDDKEFIRNVIAKYFNKENYYSDLVNMIKKNKSNVKYNNFKKMEDENLLEMFNYIDPLRFIYSLEIEGEDIGQSNSLKNTIMNYSDYKKLDIFTKYFIESLNYVFALFNHNGTTYTYNLSDVLERIDDDNDITSISVIPIPYNDKTTMFSFFKNLKYKYDEKSDKRFDINYNSTDDFGLNKKGSIIFLEDIKNDISPCQILNLYITLMDEYKNTNKDVIFTSNIEKHKFVEFLLRKLGFHIKSTRMIKYNKETIRLDVEPKPNITQFKSILSSKKNCNQDINDKVKKLSPLINFINGFSTIEEKGGNKETIDFDECHNPIILFNDINHNDVNKFLDKCGNNETDKFNFFLSEDIDFNRDLNYLNDIGEFNEDTVSNVVPLNVYYKKKFTKTLNEKLRESGGKRTYETLTDFLKSIEDKKGGLQQIYNNIGELLTDLTSQGDANQFNLINNIISSILTSNNFNTYDINILKNKIANINTCTNTRSDRELNKVSIGISELLRRLKSFEKDDKKIEAFDNIASDLDKIYFHTMSLYQYLNLIEVIRNLYMILPAYGINIRKNVISNDDIKKIDEMFLRRSLYKKNEILKRRFENLKSSLGLDSSPTDFITVIDNIYRGSDDPMIEI